MDTELNADSMLRNLIFAIEWGYFGFFQNVNAEYSIDKVREDRLLLLSFSV